MIMSKMSKKISTPNQEVKLFTRTYSQSEKQKSRLIFNFYQSENENYHVDKLLHHHHFHPLLLVNPSNHFIALQINSGTFALVMHQPPRFANFYTSNRLTIRLVVSSVFERNKLTNRSIRPKPRSLANSNESTQIAADHFQHQKASRNYFSPSLTNTHTGAGSSPLTTNPLLQSIANSGSSSNKSKRKPNSRSNTFELTAAANMNAISHQYLTKWEYNMNQLLPTHLHRTAKPNG